MLPVLTTERAGQRLWAWHVPHTTRPEWPLHTVSLRVRVVSGPSLWAAEHIVTVIAVVQICLAHH